MMCDEYDYFLETLTISDYFDGEILITNAVKRHLLHHYKFYHDLYMSPTESLSEYFERIGEVDE